MNQFIIVKITLITDILDSNWKDGNSLQSSVYFSIFVYWIYNRKLLSKSKPVRQQLKIQMFKYMTFNRFEILLLKYIPIIDKFFLLDYSIQRNFCSSFIDPVTHWDYWICTSSCKQVFLVIVNLWFVDEI